MNMSKKLQDVLNEDLEVYTKSEVINFMARQGLIYNGLDEHEDKWFENYYRQWFEQLDKNKYILHGEG